MIPTLYSSKPPEKTSMMQTNIAANISYITKLHMADASDAEEINTTWSGRVKGAVKAWQFLIKKKRPRQVLSSDDESSINAVSGITL